MFQINKKDVGSNSLSSTRHDEVEVVLDAILNFALYFFIPIHIFEFFFHFLKYDMLDHHIFLKINITHFMSIYIMKKISKKYGKGVQKGDVLTSFLVHLKKFGLTWKTWIKHFVESYFF